MCDARSSLSWNLGNWSHNTLVVDKTIWGTMFIASNKIVVVNKGVTSFVCKGFWENNPNKSHSTSSLLSLLLPLAMFACHQLFLGICHLFSITHSSDLEALTLGYGVVKPNVLAMIECFLFFTFSEPNWVNCFFLSHGDKTFLQFSCLCCWYYSFSNKGSRIWDDKLKMVLNPFHLKKLLKYWDKIIASLVSFWFCSWFYLFHSSNLFCFSWSLFLFIIGSKKIFLTLYYHHFFQLSLS